MSVSRLLVWVPDVFRHLRIVEPDLVSAHHHMM